MKAFSVDLREKIVAAHLDRSAEQERMLLTHSIEVQKLPQSVQLALKKL
jgi:hypothetical protein